MHYRKVRFLLVLLVSTALFLGVSVICSLRDFPIPLATNDHGMITDIQRLSFPMLYGNCYNPSIIKQENSYLLSFRWDRPKKHFKNLIKSARWSARETRVCIVELDNQCVPSQVPQVLHLVDQQGIEIKNPEDMRIFVVADKIVGIFNAHVKHSDDHTLSSIQLYMTTIERDSRTGSYISTPSLQLTYTGGNRVEKNWMPFIQEGEIYLVYSIKPHQILRLDISTGICHLLHMTNNLIDWPYGPLRGGTPAVLVEEGFLAFFHSVQPAKQWRKHQSHCYLMGCYLFENTPPFRIIAFPASPVFSPNLYSFRFNRRKILYPAGLVYEKSRCLLACGENDANIVILSIDTSILFRKLHLSERST